jgi:hypothetical protein
MAQHNYTTSVNFGTFDTWANNISSDSNVSLETANNDFSPDRSSGPFELSDFQNQSIFYGVMHAATGGTVQVIGPYTGTSIGEGSQTIKNVLIDSSNVVLRATAEYPYTFHSWRTAADGEGDQLSTNATLTITDGDHSSVVNFYAHFTTTHSSP